jgi:Enoyl-CoA hydratase/isomerase
VNYGIALDALGAVDVRWAATDVSFCIKEVDAGLAADLGTLARVPKLIGNTSLLYELALEGRTFGAEEASRLGLVSRVVDGSREQVVSAAIAFAKVVAAKSPVAVRGVKRFLAHALEHSCVAWVLNPTRTGKKKVYARADDGFFFWFSAVEWKRHLSTKQRGGRLHFRQRYSINSLALGTGGINIIFYRILASPLMPSSISKRSSMIT